MLTKELFLFFLQNETGQSYYRDSTGNILYTNTPTWLPQAPKGWYEQELTFGRNNHYWGLNRTYSQSFTFYGDGAEIIRYLFYNYNGIEEKIYLSVLKLDHSTDIYQPYYKGILDLSHIEDDVVTGVKVNVIDGTLQKIIKAYENTVFEIPCDGSIPENITVNLSGIMYKAVFNYAVLPCVVRDSGFYLPLVYQNKVGNDVGVIKADQRYVAFDPAQILNTGYALSAYNSSNYCFSSVRPITNFNIGGTIQLSGPSVTGHLTAYTSLGNSYDLIPNQIITSGQAYTINTTIPTLAAGENLFIAFISSGAQPDFLTTNLYFTFNSQFQDTTTVAIRPYDVLNLILRQIGLVSTEPPNSIIYTLQSDLLNQNQNLCLTCGMALRNEPGAVIKTSLSQFYDAFDAILSASMGVQTINTGFGEQLFFERFAYVLDTTNVSMQLGEVAEIKVSPAMDLFFDVLKVGYPEQKYDEKAGNQEYNTTAQYRTPVKGIQKEFKKVSNYRADSNGVEYTRFLIGSTNVSNNKSDNDIFVLNVDLNNTVSTAVTITAPNNQVLKGNGISIPHIQYNQPTGTTFASNFIATNLNSSGDLIQYINQSVSSIINITSNIQGIYDGSLTHDIRFLGIRTGQYQYPTIPVYAQLIINGVVVQQQSLIFYNQKTFNIHFEIDNQLFSFGNNFYVNIVPQDTTQPYVMELFKMTITSAGFSISQQGGQKIYTLKKVLYDNITGVDNPQIGSTPYAYNIEQLTPRRMLDAHADYIRSVFFNMPGDTLYFQTSDKNQSLSTTLNGVTITEKSDVPIGSLNSNLLFYPVYFNIKTEVPINFQDVLNNAANGHVSFTRNGKTFYGFPMTVKQRPALNEVQEWKLLCSPATNIGDLINLEYTGIDNIQLMNYGTAISYLNPVKFVPLGYNQPAQYNFIHMDNDWFINRVNFWPFKENYFQKWQTNDIIKLQCITNGLAPVIVQVYNDSGKVVYTFSLTQVNDPAIVAPLILWQGSLSLSSLNAFIADTIAGGYFYLVLTAGTGATTTSFISEGLWIRQKHDNTILFEYTHDRNTQATVFTSGFTPSFRVEGWLDEFDSESHFTTFEDQPADMVIINGIPYDLFTLNIADGLGIPDYVRKLLERIMLLSNVAIDGKLFSRNGDAKFEKKDIPGWPMSGWKLKIRSKVNSDAITLTTTGDLDANLTIEYQINTKNFGNGAGQDNIVQVEKINN